MPIAADYVVGQKYRLERPLSRGGMGSVWAARHVKLGSPVAVKFMDTAIAGSPAFVARFEREARIAANLNSPHVVHVHDFGTEEGVPYLVMELLEGQDLNTVLKQRGRIPLADAVRLLAQAGKGLRCAHERQLVHRDLKPANLFLARVGDDEIVKVLDFGIAKETAARIGSEVTKTGEILGSPHYMSPEQLEGDAQLDLQSDLWSLAVILFRAITGVLPFRGEQVATLIVKILHDPIPAATQFAPDLPPAIDGFFARALARKRTERFKSLEEMLSELRRIAGAPSLPSIPDVEPSPLRSPVSGPAPADSVATIASPRRGASNPQATGGTVSPVPEAQPLPGTSPDGPVAESRLAVSGTLAGTDASRTRRLSWAPVAIVVTVVVLGAGAAFTVLRLDRGADGAVETAPAPAPADAPVASPSATEPLPAAQEPPPSVMIAPGPTEPAAPAGVVASPASTAPILIPAPAPPGAATKSPRTGAIRQPSVPPATSEPTKPPPPQAASEPTKPPPPSAAPVWF